MNRITIIEGDGIGAEVMTATLSVLDALNLPLTYDFVNAGTRALEATGELVPNDVYTSLERNKIALKGPITTPIGKGFKSLNVLFRKKYDLYANVRPVQTLEGISSPFKNIDLVIFRENTEDLYAGIETQISPDECHSLKVITRSNSKRIAIAAFEYANKHHKNTVTVVHKANIMKLSDGLFLETVRQVAGDYPHIHLNEILVDNMCMQLVKCPEIFDVIVTENLYGDILSDLCAGLVGGLGVVPGANIGKDYAIFEAVHGSAPDIAGKGIANPTALMLSAAMMLDYMNFEKEADQLRAAIHKTLTHNVSITYDLGGHATTEAFTHAIIKNLK